MGLHPEELGTTWPMVSASYLPLLTLVLARVAGASALAAANVGLVTAALLLTVHAWLAGDRPGYAVGNCCSPARLQRSWAWP